MLSLLGASGCGKSMTLRCIAGIEKPDRGRIVLDGRTLFDSEKRINLPPQKRRVGYLFQQYALFPNMSVRQNIAAGIRDKKNSGRILSEILHTMGLEELGHLRPHQLSGGQQQRAALARILVSEPELLLLDEPFSALDSHLRFRLEQELSGVIRGFGKSVILVSHDRDEVFRLSDSIAVMHGGRLDTVGPKHEVFRSPVTRNGAVMTGCKNISPIRKLAERRVLALDWDLELGLDTDADGAEFVGIRMHHIRSGGTENRFRFRVVGELENPFSYTVMLRREDRPEAAPICWEPDKERWQKMRSELVELCLPPDSILLLKG